MQVRTDTSTYTHQCSLARTLEIYAIDSVVLTAAAAPPPPTAAAAPPPPAAPPPAAIVVDIVRFLSLVWAD